MLQVSLVHSSLAMAAEHVPSLKAGLAGYWQGRSRLPNFGSALLVRWAAHMDSVNISDDLLGCPGLAEFMAAAAQATNVRIESHSLMSAAKADYLLHRCSAVTTLTLTGSVMPTTLPPTVTTLQAQPAADERRSTDMDPLQCNALLYRLERLPCLSQLSLILYDCTLLSCPICLPQLQELQLELSVDSADMDLSWVQLQACPAFDCTVDLAVEEAAKHKAVVTQLQSLTIRTLSLFSSRPYTGVLQRMWSQLRVCSLHLMVGDKLFVHASEALQYLPASCSELVIEDDYHVSADGDIFIHWAALVGHAMKIRIIAESCTSIHFLDAGHAAMAAPSCLQQPWQLVVYGAKSVNGLPASLATGHTYLQQNAAARNAGWIDDSS